MRVGLNGGVPTLWDDFATMGSTTTFSPALWSTLDSDVFIADDRLHLASEVRAPPDVGFGVGTALNAMYPASFTAWRSTVAIVESSPAGAPNGVGMVGAFYGTGPAGLPGDATGDVRARVYLQVGSAGYSVTRCTNPACTVNQQFLAGGLLTPSPSRPLDLGTVHTLAATWDPGGEVFTFQLDDAVPAQADTSLSAPLSSPTPRVPFHNITTNASAPVGGSARIDATVEDVRAAPR